MQSTPRPVVADPPNAPTRDGGDASDPTYWHSLINETEAGQFLGLSVRTMQSKRVYGGGPRYIRLSARCIRYRRIDLKEDADRHMVRSTSGPGSGM